MHKLICLPNGVRIVFVPVSEAIYFGIAVSFAAGSRYEEYQKSGGAHLLEHLMTHAVIFHPSFEALAEQLDRYIATFDAETRRTVVSLKFEAKRSNLARAIDLVAHIALRPLLSREALDRERNRVLDESLLDEDDAGMIACDLAEEMTFDGSALSHTIAGSEQHLDGLTVTELRYLHRSIACGERIAVAVVGNFDLVIAEREVRRRFIRVPRGERAFFSPFHVSQTAPRLRLVNVSGNTVHVCISFPCVGFGHADRLSVSMLNNHLGAESRRSSRISLRLIGGGFSYIARSEVWHYSDAGALSIYVAVKPKNLSAVLTILGEEIERLRTKRLTGNELDLASRALKSAARERRFDSMNLAGFYAQQLLATGEVVTSDQYIRSVNQLRARDLRRVAQNLFQTQRMNVVIAGPLDQIDAAAVAPCLKISAFEEGSTNA